MQNDLILPDIAVLQSINPPHCANIASLIKSIEVRKTRPKLETPFKCYIYCTNDRSDFLWVLKEDLREFCDGKNTAIFRAKEGGGVTKANGKVIGEYVCDEIIEFTADEYSDHSYCISDDELAKTCLSQEELWSYGKGKTLYGYHILNLVIYDSPKELSEFYIPCYSGCAKCEYKSWDTAYGGEIKEMVCTVCNKKPLTRPPQNWCYVKKTN